MVHQVGEVGKGGKGGGGRGGAEQREAICATEDWSQSQGGGNNDTRNMCGSVCVCMTMAKILIH
jgi:hypothetical protein